METAAKRTPFSRRGFIAAGVLAAAAASLEGCARPGATGDAPAQGPGSDSLPLRPSSQGAGADGPQGNDSPAGNDPLEQLLASMTLKQKVAQLFIVTPEALTGASRATVAGELTEKGLKRIPVGGICYFGQNLESAQQVRELLAGTRELATSTGARIAPFLSVDEEGGPLVARVANSGLFDVPAFPNMAEIGATRDAARAAEVGATIGGYLQDIGFNLDFAPSADVLTNPENTVIGPRAFGSDPELVADMVSAEVEAMLDAGTLPCVKHFPGHGDTPGDSHTGAAVSSRTREQITSCELEPFRAAISAGCPLVMVGHIETPAFAADGLPASLSPTMITGVLRGELGFTGVIVSDSFSMGAITQRFSAADAAVRFFLAGGDMLLLPENLEEAYQGVLDAVYAGTLSEDDIDERVLRVLAAKQEAGIV